MRPEDSNFPPEIPPVPSPRGSGQSKPAAGNIEPGLDLRTGEPLPEATESQSVESQAAESRDSVPQDSGPENGDRNNLSQASQPINPAPPAPTSGGEGRAYPLSPPPWTDDDLRNSEDLSAAPPARAKPVYTSRRQPPQASRDRNSRSISPAEDVWTDADIPYQPKELGVVDQLLLLLAEVATRWKKVLRWVRSQLPPDLQRQLSDGLLTAIALGLLMLFLALWNPLGAGQSSEQVASESPSAEAPVPPAEAYFSEAPPQAPIVDSDSNPAPDPATVVDPTPEQNLIADIQSRVSRISRSYGAGLIRSVEVNLPENTLDVNVAEAWYGLLGTQQNEVAQDIFAQAQGLNFGTLQLRDPEGVVVARNPVVGPNMVVLHRMRWP